MSGNGLEAAALMLLAGEGSPLQAARATGYGDAASFRRAFARRYGTAPEAFAGLPRSGGYRFTFNAPFHLGKTLQTLGRDPDSLAERLAGNRYTRFFPLGGGIGGGSVLAGGPVRVTLALDENGCEVRVRRRLHPARYLELHGLIRRVLGLDQPLAAFYRVARGDRVFGPLVKKFPGVRIPVLPSLWEALCWAVVGQQINLAFAYRLRNRLIRLGNPNSRHSLLPFPTPEQIARLTPAQLRQNQFSRQKSEYLRGLARAFLNGPLSGLTSHTPVEEAEATMLAVKGLGRWSAAYGLMRGLGHPDALPVGDAGLRTALKIQFGLAEPPSISEQERLMEPFRPFRSLATYYLWRSLDLLPSD